MNVEVKDVPIAELLSWADNPRKDAGKLDDLVESIRVDGIIEPLVVRNLAKKKKKRELQIICGWRRRLAAENAGLEAVPCLIHDEMDDDKAWRISLSENIQRQNLNPIEEAEAFDKAFQAGMSIEDIGDAVRVSSKYVTRRRALLNLDQKVRIRVIAGELTLSVALEIARVKDKKTQKEVASRIAPWMSSRQARAVVKKVLDRYVIEETPWAVDVEYADRPACDGCPFNSVEQTEQFALDVFTEEDDEKYEHYEHDSNGRRRCYDKLCFDHKEQHYAKALLAEAKEKGKQVMTRSEWNEVGYNARQSFEYTPEFDECDACNHGHAMVFDDERKRFQFAGCLDMKCHRKMLGGSDSSGGEMTEEEKEERRQRRDRSVLEAWVRDRALASVRETLADVGLESEPALRLVAYQVARHLSPEDYQIVADKAGVAESEDTIHLRDRFQEVMVTLNEGELVMFILAACSTQLELLNYEDSGTLAVDLGFKETDLVLNAELLSKLSKVTNLLLLEDFDLEPVKSKGTAVEAVLDVPEEKRKGLSKTLKALVE